MDGPLGLRKILVNPKIFLKSRFFLFSNICRYVIYGFSLSWGTPSFMYLQFPIQVVVVKNADPLFIVLVNFRKQRISRCVNWTMVPLDCFAKILAKRLDQKVRVQVTNRFKRLDLVQVVQVEPLLNPLTLVGKYQAKHIGIASLFGV